MQPSYALLPATSYPKMEECAMPKLELKSIGLKVSLVNNQSGARRQVAWVVDILSWHAVAQS